MRETEQDLQDLQALLDRSHANAGAHLRSIFDESHLLTARALADGLHGTFEMHLAALAGDGAPLVAPVDGILCRGKVWFGVPSGSVRSRLLRRDARVSASFTQGSFALIVHGKAVEATPGDPTTLEYRSLVRELYVEQYGAGWIEWAERREREVGPGFTAWIEPRVMFAKR